MDYTKVSDKEYMEFMKEMITKEKCHLIGYGTNKLYKIKCFNNKDIVLSWREEQCDGTFVNYIINEEYLGVIKK